jgi:hypothetical protein
VGSAAGSQCTTWGPHDEPQPYVAHANHAHPTLDSPRTSNPAQTVHASTDGSTSAQPAPSILLQAVLQPSSLSSVLYTCMPHAQSSPPPQPPTTTSARSLKPTLAPKPNGQVMSGATDLPSSSQLDKKRVPTSAQPSRIPHTPHEHRRRQSICVQRTVCAPSHRSMCAQQGTSCLHSRRLERPCKLTWLKQHPRCGAGARGNPQSAHQVHKQARQWPCLAARVVSTNNPYDRGPTDTPYSKARTAQTDQLC